MTTVDEEDIALSIEALDRAKLFFRLPKRQNLSAGHRMGRYQILREIGRGGMAVVYEAIDTELQRSIALKILQGGTVRRLFREAIAAAQLRHPNVVAVYEVGADFIAMEYVNGRTLRQAMSAMPLPDRLRVLETVARAVGYAHEQGVVHRDLKPDNVLIGQDGRVVLTDFGLAKTTASDELTRSGTQMGTPHYMPPEQVKGDVREIGPAADIWALGVVLHELVTGHPPFEAATAPAVYQKILNEDPPSLPGSLGAIASKAMEKSADRRYAKAEHLADDLHRYLEGGPVQARTVGRLSHALRRIKRKPTVHGLALALIAVSIGVIGLTVARRQDRSHAVDDIRKQARLSLGAALELRRAGASTRMRQFLAPLESAYQEAVTRAPDLAEPDYLMGRMYRALLEEDKALQFQDRALRKDPAFVPALYERGVLLSMKHGRQLRDALGAVQSVDAVTPGVQTVERSRPDLQELRAGALAAWEAFFARGNSAQLQAQGIGEASILVGQGLLAFERGQRVESRQHLEEALRRDLFLEECWEALAWVVWADRGTGIEQHEIEWGRAEQFYGQAIARDPSSPSHYLDRAQVRIERAGTRRHRGIDPLPGYHAGIEDVTQALRLDPTSSRALIMRGNAWAAIEMHFTEIDVDPLAAWTNAEKDLTRAIELNPKSSRAWMERGAGHDLYGVYLAQQGRDPLPEYAAAERDLSESWRLDSNNFEALRTRATTRIHTAAAVAKAGRDPARLLSQAEEDFDRFPTDSADFFLPLYRSEGPKERGLYRAARGEDPLDDFARAERYLDQSLALSLVVWEPWYQRGLVRFSRAAYLEGKNQRAAARLDYSNAAADLRRALSLDPMLKLGIAARMEQARRKVIELEGAGAP